MTLPLWEDDEAPEKLNPPASKPQRVLVVEADGGSRGNPGIAAAGAVVLEPTTGQVLRTIAKYLGHASNNVAEYNGLIIGINAALELGASAIEVRMDSKLVVEQMSGRWKIKHPDMQELAQQARALLKSTPVSFQWIPRAENSLADAAANRSMDTQASFSESS